MLPIECFKFCKLISYMGETADDMSIASVMLIYQQANCNMLISISISDEAMDTRSSYSFDLLSRDNFPIPMGNLIAPVSYSRQKT